MIKAWNIRFKDGKPVINIFSDGVEPQKVLTPKNEDIKITPEGLMVGDLLCSFDKTSCSITPIKHLGVDLSHPHILHLVYEVISGYLYNKSPVIVDKVPYDIARIVAKYPEFKVNAEVFKYFKE